MCVPSEAAASDLNTLLAGGHATAVLPPLSLEVRGDAKSWATGVRSFLGAALSSVSGVKEFLADAKFSG